MKGLFATTNLVCWHFNVTTRVWAAMPGKCLTELGLACSKVEEPSRHCRVAHIPGRCSMLSTPFYHSIVSLQCVMLHMHAALLTLVGVHHREASSTYGRYLCDSISGCAVCFSRPVQGDADIGTIGPTGEDLQQLSMRGMTGMRGMRNTETPSVQACPSYRGQGNTCTGPCLACRMYASFTSLAMSGALGR